MNTRRNFLLKGSMATTALLTAKPFKTIAHTLSPVTGFCINDHKIVLVHTGNYSSNNKAQTAQQIIALKDKTQNLVLLHAGDTNEKSKHVKYDALMNTDEVVSFSANNYTILYKGDIKIGIIKASEATADLINTINNLSAFLKEEKNCNIVVCLSQLGYRSTRKIDEIQLAESSSQLDIIIGGHASNFCKQPTVLFNKNKEEIIIHHAADQNLALRKLEIEFDRLGKKKNIAFTRTIQSTQVS